MNGKLPVLGTISWIRFSRTSNHSIFMQGFTRCTSDTIGFQPDGSPSEYTIVSRMSLSESMRSWTVGGTRHGYVID
jgi:hypothetical protein